MHFVWVFVHKTSLSPQLFIEVPVSRRVSGHVFVCEIYIYVYVWKLNQTVLELDLRAVKCLFFPRRDLNPHHWYTAVPLDHIHSIYIMAIFRLDFGTVPFVWYFLFILFFKSTFVLCYLQNRIINLQKLLSHIYEMASPHGWSCHLPAWL